MIKKLPLIFFLLIFARTSFALQIKEVQEGAEIHAGISVYDLNRIRLKGDRIISAKANVGDINISYEETTGDIFIKPAAAGSSTIINLFLVSEKGYTYKLLLTATDRMSTQIVLRNSDIILDLYQQHKKDEYKESVVSLYKAMSKSSPMEGYKLALKNKKEFLAKGFKSKLTAEYSSPLYTGYVYEIESRKKNTQILKESDFFRPGVLAIKLESFYMEKGDVTRLFIIKG